MFSEYKWTTGTSPTTVLYCKTLAKHLLAKLELKNPSILELGSNDATLLAELRTKTSSNVIGVEPASSFSNFYTNGIVHIRDFFNLNSALMLVAQYGQFDLVIARNVFSHVPDLLNVIDGISQVLSPTGIFCMEFHWAKVILEELHYDSIYHEHTYYHTLKSVSDILEAKGLRIFDAQISPISGGSLNILASKQEIAKSVSLIEHEASEKHSGVLTQCKWLSFQNKVKTNLEEIKQFLNSRETQNVAAIGASARSSTILNALGSASSHIRVIADNNSRKWGFRTPGASIPICSFEELIRSSPDSIIVFPFNFRSEIEFQLSENTWHGELYFPLPHPPSTVNL
jgi:SAM-dependent methyltransferase